MKTKVERQIEERERRKKGKKRKQKAPSAQFGPNENISKNSVMSISSIDLLNAFKPL